MSDLVDAYDSGLLSSYGGGNVDWWQDYIRAELGRAHDFYAPEIERLTAELAAARAKLAQYEQAPVVGWVPDDTATVVATRGYAMFSIYKDEPPSVIGEYVQLIARPEAAHDST